MYCDLVVYVSGLRSKSHQIPIKHPSIFWRVGTGKTVFIVNRESESTVATATTYRAAAKILFCESMGFEWCVLENVTSLGQVPSSQMKHGDISDEAFIIADFRMRDWLCVSMDVEAADYGSCANRLRKIFVGMKGTGPHIHARISYKGGCR